MNQLLQHSADTDEGLCTVLSVQPLCNQVGMALELTRLIQNHPPVLSISTSALRSTGEFRGGKSAADGPQAQPPDTVSVRPVLELPLLPGHQKTLELGSLQEDSCSCKETNPNPAQPSSESTNALT